MDLGNWFRTWGKNPDARSTALLRAAAAGAETVEIAQLAAQEFCAAAQADRAGVWLLREDPQVLEGAVVESGRGPVRPEWVRLDRSMPFLEMLLSSGEPVAVDLKKVPQAAALGPLARMRTAAWIPLRAGGRAVGLVLVAYALSRMRVPPESLRERADAVAVIASERLAHAALQRLRAEWSALLDATEDGVLVLDVVGRVRFANAQFLALAGLGTAAERGLKHHPGALDALADSLEGNLVWSKTPGAQEHEESFASHWRDLRSRGEQSGWIALELLRPEHRQLERRVWTVKDSTGRTAGWLEVFRDVTREQESRARMHQVEKLAALGQLVSGIAHELSNPLTSILGYAQLLLGVRGGERQADLHRVYQEAERARRIVSNLLLFARESRPEKRAADLNEIVERTLALRGYELTLENILLEASLAPGLPPVLVDAHAIQQVLLNLVVNAEQAILHSRPEGTAGHARGHIRVRTWLREGRVLLEVADDGPGIPPEAEARIFDPFFTTKPMGQGTGLGLSIAGEIVREHGGKIYVHRERPGGHPSGATLIVELPVRAGDQMPAPETSAHPAPAMVLHPGRKGAPAEVRARVLVVEDEPTVAHLLADVLEDEGHEVETVLDSREGLQRAQRETYDLLMCDLRMPQLDGRGLYEALLQSGADVHGRVIFITGDTLSPRTLDFLEKNRLPYLAKPFLVEELKEVVGRVLARRNAAKQREPGRTRPGPAIVDARKNPRSTPSDSRREAVRKK
jgi:two-component system NtrC family sensor kinase